MNIIETKIPGLLIIEPKVFNDARGYFFETFHTQKYKDADIDADFIQDNEAFSGYGVIRGLHYQLAPYSQAKLVRVIKGSVYDVAVDVREGSPTFGEWVGIELSETNKLQFFVPRGFAHGYSVISETAIFSYKCDNFYHPQSERGINFNDKNLNIDWKIPEQKMIISVKDNVLPTLENADLNFNYGKKI
ncbi:MAG TPA: dTDP-4-dehydrorhamnose 3,5-epimerase [Marinilabiliales bacterium]|nr:MAG: dTDP-4-dehydrorhamnose 3,5-epimerase [Bacteroidetes bacterium GWA2_40_14]OFX62732.1 MAG: dTDP-4-dehydrorhamnose 3,5-epimerase [Bacteroidetes bacterium GWC2_40_13]OFX71999.1 MAG: dTDP-4-dehydrorhamnose 3,5-epimerase [Bacteroidetes bacterium GWD2_40_43]OFX89604.1 MAG: dTDP-4-dehydrorhamnose 3,5-epimerase [Bacteroidetes bacterium GWE2_40_63]OFY24123.1 MAG: dTDP-4-dehydrorhamnose 3,5-epimerase [Bacteroidetes bacterium GWF2_40_13]OFZ26315.1 MAG: dTDP-4-dehydrorhamnose 3,5-epimerase [Bactero